MPIWNLRDNQNFIFDYFNQVINFFVNLKSNLALLSHDSHN